MSELEKSIPFFCRSLFKIMFQQYEVLRISFNKHWTIKFTDKHTLKAKDFSEEETAKNKNVSKGSKDTNTLKRS